MEARYNNCIQFDRRRNIAIFSSRISNIEAERDRHFSSSLQIQEIRNVLKEEVADAEDFFFIIITLLVLLLYVCVPSRARLRYYNYCHMHKLDIVS